MGVRAYPRQVINLNARDLLQASIDMMGDTSLSYGADSRRFERHFSEKIRVSQTVPVPSARFGLALLLQELGLKQGDEVVIATYTFHAMPNIIAALGLRPVFADIRETDFNIDPESVRRVITRKTKAIVATHIYGQPAEMAPLMEIAEKHGIPLIEDCAEATGAEYRRKPVGGLGTAGIFSFSMGKPLVGLGGGAITTSDDNLAERLRRRTEGLAPPRRASLLKSALAYGHLCFSSHPRTFIFTTYPLLLLTSLAGQDLIDGILSSTRKRETRLQNIPASMSKGFCDIQARLLLRQLSRLDEMNLARIKVAREYDRAFGGAERVIIANLSPENKNIYNAYGIRLRREDIRGIQRRLIRRGIDTKQRHMYVCSAMEMFREFSVRCPVAERVFRELLHLPINHYMDVNDATYIAKSILEEARG